MDGWMDGQCITHPGEAFAFGAILVAEALLDHQAERHQHKKRHSCRLERGGGCQHPAEVHCEDEVPVILLLCAGSRDRENIYKAVWAMIWHWHIYYIECDSTGGKHNICQHCCCCCCVVVAVEGRGEGGKGEWGSLLRGQDNCVKREFYFYSPLALSL